MAELIIRPGSRMGLASSIAITNRHLLRVLLDIGRSATGVRDHANSASKTRLSGRMADRNLRRGTKNVFRREMKVCRVRHEWREEGNGLVATECV